MRGFLICDNCACGETRQHCVQWGFGIEVQAFYDPHLLQRDPSAVAAHQALLEGIGLRAIHAPFGDLNAGSFDGLVREITLNRYELGYDTARSLSAQHAVYHLGYVPNTSPIPQWVPRCVESWRKFLSGKEHRLQYHIENLLEEDCEVLLEVLAGIASPQVDACLDIGHAHAFSKRPVLEWIEKLGARIGYVHMHDNHGLRDEHLRVGAGSLPLLEVCQALEQYAPHACWALEMEAGGIRESIDWLGCHGFLAALPGGG